MLPQQGTEPSNVMFPDVGSARPKLRQQTRKIAPEVISQSSMKSTFQPEGSLLVCSLAKEESKAHNKYKWHTNEKI